MYYSDFGHQCDAITKSGKRCKHKNHTCIPIIINVGVFNSYKRFRTVRLCRQHNSLLDRLKRKDRRLKLHHRGWLGAYNTYGYGNVVTTSKFIDWMRIKRLLVPTYWSIPIPGEQSDTSR